MKTSETESNKIIETIIGKQDIKDLFINLFILALVPAVCEEFFFRALIQKGIIRSTRNVWLGILLSAFIFSAFHFQFLTFLSRFEMGIILGALFWYSGSIWVSIAAHFVFNGIQLVFSYWKPEMVDPPSWAVSAELVGLSFLVVTVLIMILRKTSSVTMSEVFDDDDDDNFIIEQKDLQ
jgi:membrane protease YdiL (CAAX protease family)